MDIEFIYKDDENSTNEADFYTLVNVDDSFWDYVGLPHGKVETRIDAAAEVREVLLRIYDSFKAVGEVSYGSELSAEYLAEFKARTGSSMDFETYLSSLLIGDESEDVWRWIDFHLNGNEFDTKNGFVLVRKVETARPSYANLTNRMPASDNGLPHEDYEKVFHVGTKTVERQVRRQSSIST